MENTVQSKVAIIGLGHIGKALALNFTKGRRPIIVADRDLDKAQALAAELGTLVRPLDVPAAIRQADIVVLAIWFDTIKAVLKQYAAELEGKIIIDPSNPIAPDDNGGFVKIIGQDESAGATLAHLLPAGAKLVKALGTLGAASLENAAHQTPEPAVLFYATDATGIHAEVEQLIRDAGFEPLQVGGLDQSIRIEVFGDLHQFGALGKTVTLAEALETV
jgi:predicted dinucleotide-binding enzyme